MGAVIPAAPRRPSRYVVGDLVDIRIVKVSKAMVELEREWRQGKVVKVTRHRVTVDYESNRGRSQRRQTVPFNRVRHRQAPQNAEACS